MLFDKVNIKVIIVGVLKWEEREFAKFSDENRKDVELYNKFIEAGVYKSDITLLLDEQATLHQMKKKVDSVIKSCDKDSTFLFYYTGHGYREKEMNKYFLCNYDFKRPLETRFNIRYLLSSLKNFIGKRIMLLADCCYSGSLLNIGKQLSTNLDKEILVITSSSESNISTVNWTFTQTLIDNFYQININKVLYEIKNAMKFREKQMYGFYLYNIDQFQDKINTLSDDYSINEYVYIPFDDKWITCKINNIDGDMYEVEYYKYSDKYIGTINKKMMRKIQFPDYSKYENVSVLWKEKYYPAKILKSDNDFYYVKYDGFGDEWNEWIMYDRIRTGREKKHKIKWKNVYYDGYVLDEKDDKVFITYSDFDNTWNEWMNKTNIK